MKWTSKQFMVPILIGFSLTSVSLALIYLLYKKDDEYSDREYIETAHQKTIECKVPKQFVPAVIGRGGMVIKDIQQKTSTRIHFNEDSIECSERICLIRGNREGILLAEQMIKSIIANQPVIETYEMYVPQKACGRIIGRGSETINHIQMTCSAKIIVENNYSSRDPNAKRRIIIKGTSEQIAAALSQIEDKIQEDKEALLKLEASSSLRLPRGKLSPRNTALNSSKQTQSTELPPPQVVNGLMEVYVSAMESPSQFWVQVVGPGTAALDKLVSEMTSYYNENENRDIHVLKNITLGQMVAARFSFDEQWYRAEIISTAVDGCCEVYFVDYGDREMVDIQYILELRTDFLSLRLQAVECCLANIKSREAEWSNEICEKFAELTWLAQWKVLLAKVRGYKERSLSYGRTRREGSPIPCVDLYDRTGDKDIDVGQELVNEGLAEREEIFLSAGSSSSLSMHTSDICTASNSMTSPSSTTYANSNNKTSYSLDVSHEVIGTVPSSSKIQEIDLTTPEKSVESIEEIDLVTPVKDETSRFIDNEKKVHRENSNYLGNGSTHEHRKISDSNLKLPKSARTAPAGYESDLSEDSDEMELG